MLKSKSRYSYRMMTRLFEICLHLSAFVPELPHLALQYRTFHRHVLLLLVPGTALIWKSCADLSTAANLAAQEHYRCMCSTLCPAPRCGLHLVMRPFTPLLVGTLIMSPVSMITLIFDSPLRLLPPPYSHCDIYWRTQPETRSTQSIKRTHIWDQSFLDD